MSRPAGAQVAALVTDGYWRKTVAAVRALGRAGAAADVSDPRRVAPAGFSRHCRRRLRSPDPTRAPEAFAAWAFRQAASRAYSLLLPTEEASCLALSRAREGRPCAAWIPVPPPGPLEDAGDKLRAAERAQAVGIPTPATRSFGPGDRLPPGGEWVLKPRRGTGARGLRRLRGGPEAGPLARNLERRFGPLVLQSLVPGRRNGFGVSLLYDARGRCRAAFVHRKLREYPASGGVSTCAESVHRPDLVALARRYVEGEPRLPWQGLVNLEFKVHPADGTPRLLEVNPRLWGSVALAVRAGIDFPALLWELSLGRDPPPAFACREGVRLRWTVYGELAHAWQRLRRGEIPWDVLGEESHGDFLWDPADPLPFWTSLAAWGLALGTPEVWAWLRR
ncbi:MAG: ATP-grasp domain-containing protein [Thermodesulfobacteriota bacterium]